MGLALGTSLLGWRLARAGGLLPVGDWLPFVVLALAYELIRAFGPVLLRSVCVNVGAEIERALLNGTIGSTLLQGLMRPSGLFDALALAATLIDAFHTLIPVVVGYYLWSRHRRAFYDFTAALVIFSLAAFATYLLLPAAPPWWTAAAGHLPAGSGQPLLDRLQTGIVDNLLGASGLAGNSLPAVAIGDLSPDPVAALPSLHEAYPVLAYLCLRELPGRARRVMLAFGGAAWFSIIYLGEHYLADIAGGLAYAGAAWYLVRSRGHASLAVD